MSRLYFILIAIFLIVSVKLQSQDMQFSQFFSSPIYLSPSLAGAGEDSRIIANYRNQWPGLPRAFTSYAVSFDHYLFDYKSGIGALIKRNQEGGVYNLTSMNVSYTYAIDVNRELKVRPGISAGYFFRDIDYSSIEFADQISRNANASIEIQKNEHIGHYDFTSSLLAYTSFFWLGITGDHLLAINKQFANDYTYPALKLTVYGGAKLKMFESVRSKTDRTFTIAFFYKNQADFNQLDLGTYYEEEPFRIGIFFRGIPVFKEAIDLNAIVLLAGYNYRKFRINYSYDISTSRLLASTGGAHELSVAYQFTIGWGGKKHRMGAVPCPSF